MATPEPMLRRMEFIVFTEKVHDLPVHHTFHDHHHNAGKAYGSVVLGAMLASLLVHRGDVGTGPVRWQLSVLSDRLKRATSGSESQGAPSFKSLPGTQSGPQALEGSMRDRALYTSSSLNDMFSTCSVLLLNSNSLYTKIPGSWCPLW